MMTLTFRTALASANLALALAVVAPAGLHAQGSDPAARDVHATSTAPFLWQPSMNVFRRFAVDRARMVEFYGDVLGLEALPTFNLGGGSQMTRLRVGTSEIKLTTTVPRRQYHAGAVNEVVGLRLLTFFFPDEGALTARFVSHGYPAPAFRDIRSGTARAALVQDADGQWVKLVVVPGAPADVFDHLEVGITTSDLEASRAFYREFVGLDELPPVRDELLGTMTYPYRHGTTTVTLWTFGTGLPVDNGSAGIQYVVWNVDGVDALARARKVTIDQPLRGAFGTLRTVWLEDPDGVTNYFAETARAREEGPPK
jgi:catechol 2,3-dioxygenase-like lactoylglutathione lyase family enzyme